MQILDFCILCYKYPRIIWSRFWGYRRQRVRSSQLKSTKPFHYAGKTSLLVCNAIIGLVLSINVVVGVWAAIGHKIEEGWTVVLYTGQCGVARRTNLSLHLVVNFLASILFATSAYVMQRLAAPTREDIDRAHSTGRSLSIGTLSITNFALMSRKRLAVFVLLWASSLPIHLLYNSLFEYVSTNAEAFSYKVLVPSTLVPQTSVNNTVVLGPSRAPNGYLNVTPEDLDTRLASWLSLQQPCLERLDVHDCLQAYESGASIDMGDLLVVIDYGSDAETSFQVTWPDDRPSRLRPWSWMCGADFDCDEGSVFENEATWTISGSRVEYCLARKLPQQCQLNMNLTIMVVVIAVNVCKICAIVMTLFVIDGQTILIVGDAIASFLEIEDKTTIGKSIADKDAFGNFWTSGYHKISTDRLQTKTSRYTSIQHEMQGSLIYSSICGFILLSFCFGFFGWMYYQTQLAYGVGPGSGHFSLSVMGALGLGNVPPVLTDTEVGFTNYSGASTSSSYIRGACLANLPQLALSFLYLVYNNYFIRFQMAFEFRSLAIQRRGLRVTVPVEGSDQRRTYLLQFPLKWTVLMIIYFILLHTFMSESIFLSRIYYVWPQSYTDPDDIGKQLQSSIGFSPLGLMCLSIILSILVFAVIASGFVKRDWNLPCLNGDSRSISAACHPPEGSRNTHLAKVRWGVVSMGSDGIGRCSLSALPVRPPELGERFL